VDFTPYRRHLLRKFNHAHDMARQSRQDRRQADLFARERVALEFWPKNALAGFLCNSRIFDGSNGLFRPPVLPPAFGQTIALFPAIQQM